MPDIPLVYAIVFSRTADGDTRFIGFQRKARAYFAHTNNGTEIAPDGQPLVGAGKFVLPGMTFAGTDWNVEADVEDQCRKAFARACGKQLRFASTDEIVAGQINPGDRTVHANSYLNRWSSSGFAALYIQVADSALRAIADHIRHCLDQAQAAVNAIASHELSEGDGDKIAELFPLAPLDDGIALIDPPIGLIAAGEFSSSPLIRGLLDDSDTERFAELIQGLEIVGS